MTEPALSADERFKRESALQLDNKISVRVDSDEQYIVLRDEDEDGTTFLGLDEVRALRDWLNKVLP